VKLPNHVSDTIKRLNPSIYGPVAGLGSTRAQPALSQALDRPAPRRQSRSQSVRVIFIAMRRRLLDSDNNVFSLKPARDAIARRLGVDDADPRIEWSYHQIKTSASQGVIVKIEANRL
jgi:hypothetical protein